jgi:hypothetical protein
MPSLEERMHHHLLSYEEMVRQVQLEYDPTVTESESLKDFKQSREVQAELVYQTVVRLHATGKWTDEDLLEFARAWWTRIHR